MALGGSIAAALVAAVTLLPSGPAPETATQVAQTQTEAVQLAAAVDNQMWSMTFTATPDEESVL